MSVEAQGEGYMKLTTGQRTSIQVMERLGASLSLLTVFLVFAAYGAFKRLRTMPNSFILFASSSNVVASVACLMGYSGISKEASALCQAQAFLLELFMQADPYWSAAMSINVCLVFFRSADPERFHTRIWIFFAVCFGMPAVPSVTLLIMSSTQIHQGRRPLYGDATLWCWISDDYSTVRILTYYMPIWICALISAAVYICVGHQIFKQRNQLRDLTLSNQAEHASAEAVPVPEPVGVHSHHPYGTVTTEVQITSANNALWSGPSSRPTDPILPPYTPPRCHLSNSKEVSATFSGLQGQSNFASHNDFDGPMHARVTTSASSTTPFAGMSSVTARRGSDVEDPNGKSKVCGILGRVRATIKAGWKRIFCGMDPVKHAYLRTSLWFGLSVLMTWLPSSINRIYTFVHPGSICFALNIASATVLPLQGVWNGVIFGIMSRAIVREEVKNLLIRKGWVHRRDGVSGSVGGGGSSGLGPGGGRVGNGGAVAVAGPSDAWGYGLEEYELHQMGSRMRVARDASFAV